MDWSRFGRLWSYPRRNLSPRSRWEYIGLSRDDAFRMMDGSTCEEDLRRRGRGMARAFAAALEIGPAHQVLEVGCGVARVGRELAPLCGAYIGADISRSLLRRARTRAAGLRNLSLVHLEGAGLPGLPDAAFERLICHLVFLHLDEPEIRRLLKEFGRVLTPAGMAYFDAWNLRHGDVWDLFRRESLDPRTRRLPHRSRFYTREAVEDWLDASGLVPLWVSDGAFLVQVVAGRQDGDARVQQAMAARLKEQGRLLIPSGSMDFFPPRPGLPGS